ncbi:SMP-30/gluconolactonase/LRE family protein [Pararhodobacter zhoushanensis]|uniref:SMP-30/gluconolactonase/LRE family protein n=1 Tax=Pararhodobacter zhoushanensis TaxID=2479545 RepID=A0ABT3GYY2_9RHOB|nr:SMP-30/gluconolactonase/LRE family protein [Pararhodobacter zhoushanensis]MCW1932736.1 SMP-30/gluconolactonase/LRE family protein [Pararhodobacter zhoushanensis]
MRNPLDGFTVTAQDLWYVGEDLQRPECILAEPDGSLWSADARGGVVHIRPDGTQALVAQSLDQRFGGTLDEADRFTQGTLPNGLAFDVDGSILISNFGTDRLERMTRDGRTTVVLDTIDGTAIGKVNFVLRDSQGRIWLTISTRITNWMAAISPKLSDGYVAVLDNDGARIVADGFMFTNEIRFDAAEEWLYVVETSGRRVTRLRVGEGATVLEREVFGPSDTGGFIDGIAFDSFGNLWGTHVMSDRIFAITPQGDFRVILDDDNPGPSAALYEAFERDAVTPNHMLACGGQIAPWFASVTFGGPDLQTLYIGSLRGTRIPAFRSPVAGLPMAHWR